MLCDHVNHETHLPYSFSIFCRGGYSSPAAPATSEPSEPVSWERGEPLKGTISALSFAAKRSMNVMMPFAGGTDRQSPVSQCLWSVRPTGRAGRERSL